VHDTGRPGAAGTEGVGWIAASIAGGKPHCKAWVTTSTPCSSFASASSTAVAVQPASAIMAASMLVGCCIVHFHLSLPFWASLAPHRLPACLRAKQGRCRLLATSGRGRSHSTGSMNEREEARSNVSNVEHSSVQAGQCCALRVRFFTGACTRDCGTSRWPRACSASARPLVSRAAVQEK
jgi:hypothetical protein